jgi:mono/diheme cytochrome c family protein
MADHLQESSRLPPKGKLSKGVEGLTTFPAAFLVLLALIWVGLPLIPEDTGLRFGMGYRVFFTAMTLLGGLLFWLLGRDSIPVPSSTTGVMGSLIGVFLLTVGLLVLAGVAYPQFELPLPPEAVAQDAAERGEGLFWSGTVGCFRCHAISGKGGTRGPDLTGVASRAKERVPGLTAEQYLTEKVKQGASYEFTVPEYTPMMPQFNKILADEQLEDLITFLLTLE